MPAQPIPIRTRPAASIVPEVAAANSAVPAVVNSSIVASVRRAPKRSSSTPVGTCMAAYAKKNALATPDTWAGVNCISTLKCGAITPKLERKNRFVKPSTYKIASTGRNTRAKRAPAIRRARSDARDSRWRP